MVLGCGRMRTPRACVRSPAPVMHQAKDTGPNSVPGTVPQRFAHARASSTLRGSGGPGAEIDPHDQVRCERPQGPRPQGTTDGRRPLHPGPPHGLAVQIAAAWARHGMRVLLVHEYKPYGIDMALCGRPSAAWGPGVNPRLAGTGHYSSSSSSPSPPPTPLYAERRRLSRRLLVSSPRALRWVPVPSNAC